MMPITDSYFSSDKDCLRCLLYLLQTYRPTSLADCLKLTALAERIYATFPPDTAGRR
ncbi:MAG: hypothetical protein ACFCUG_13845 [Thiotrichales bacterium]